MSKHKITKAEYRSAVRADMGWCSHCREFTADGVEPDAIEYDCPQCENPTVYGAEQALIMGLFEVGGGQP